jgi:CheY-like chemotaxis protein
MVEERLENQNIGITQNHRTTFTEKIMILLINPAGTFTKPLTAALPAFVSLLRVSTVKEAIAYLKQRPRDAPLLTCIVFDATSTAHASDESLITYCRQLCEDDLTKDIPIVAIIDNLNRRQIILEAGFNDYLPTPLLTSEIKTKLSTYLHSVCYGFNIVTEIVKQMSKAASPSVLNKGVEQLAGFFYAPSAWLYILESPRQTVRVAGEYNAPPILTEKSALVQNGIIANLKQSGSHQPHVFDSATILVGHGHEITDFSHYLSIPLYNSEQLVGALNFAYPEAPQISRPENKV